MCPPPFHNFVVSLCHQIRSEKTGVEVLNAVGTVNFPRPRGHLMAMHVHHINSKYGKWIAHQ